MISPNKHDISAEFSVQKRSLMGLLESSEISASKHQGIPLNCHSVETDIQGGVDHVRRSGFLKVDLGEETMQTSRLPTTEIIILALVTILWAVVGEEHCDVSDCEAAVTCYRKTVELDPDIVGSWALVADAHLEVGQYEEAIAACEEGLRIDPMNAESHYNLGRAYFHRGDKDLASEEYEVLNELDEELAKNLYKLVGETEQ
jgi:tetratricopeptide (TPR) repeat protein